ncbi:MAG TPA: response regulator transcription factor, partial [Sulfitobacter sp.]|nr:response regulator transcription factor [Sulfitobacter sp.]
DADIFLRHEGADLIVLDCNLPGCDGLEVLSRLRRRGDGTPVILLTARAETSERVAGLDAGADDYLTKPFEMDELEARLRAMARRKNLEFAARDAIGPLVFDRTNRQLLKDEQPLAFPRKELATLECLLERRGRIVSKSQLITHVYGTGAAQEDSAIEPHVSRLRKRLEPFGIRIKAARGLGYMLEVDSA